MRGGKCVFNSHHQTQIVGNLKGLDNGANSDLTLGAILLSLEHLLEEICLALSYFDKDTCFVGMTMTNCGKGSVVLGMTLSDDTLQASDPSTSIQNYQFTELAVTSVSTQTTTGSSNSAVSLGLVLGVTIPLAILLVVIIIVIKIKCSSDI